MFFPSSFARRIRWALFVVCLAGVASCRRGEPEPLRIGVNPWPGYELFFLAEELGYFAAEGVEVQLVEQSSLKDSRRIYVRGLVDAMLGTPIDLAVIRAEHARPAEAHFAFSYSSGGDAIVARQPLHAMSDLKGKRVAIEQGLGDYLLARALESAGMSLADVRIVYLPYALADESLRTGAVDAIHTGSPILHRLTGAGGPSFNAVFTSRELPGEVADMLIVDPEVAKNRSEDLQRVERAYDRACLFLKHDPVRAFRVMADREGVEPAEMARTFREDLTLIVPSERARYLGPDGPAMQAGTRFQAMLEEAAASSKHATSPGHAPPKPKS